MGLLTLLQRTAHDTYRVRVKGLGRFPEETFRTLDEAREYADYIAATTDAVCLIYFGKAKGTAPIYRIGGNRGDDTGSSGVREPRRPVPGSSAGAAALDLPD
jgi:hypothetical protein